MMQYHILATDEDDIQLSVMLGKKGYYMPSLLFKKEFLDIPNDIYWDNEHYLFQTFYPFLIRYKAKMLFQEDKDEFKEITHLLEDGNTIDQLIEMFETAIKQKWYDRETNN